MLLSDVLPGYVTDLEQLLARRAWTPTVPEVEALEALCHQHGYTAEAARVRSWRTTYALATDARPLQQTG